MDNCHSTEDITKKDWFDYYNDILLMMIGHGIFIFFYGIKKCLSKKTDLTYYSKTLCVIIMIISYMGAFLNLQFVSIRQDFIDFPDTPVNMKFAPCLNYTIYKHEG